MYFVKIKGLNELQSVPVMDQIRNLALIGVDRRSIMLNPEFVTSPQVYEWMRLEFGTIKKTIFDNINNQKQHEKDNQFLLQDMETISS